MGWGEAGAGGGQGGGGGGRGGASGGPPIRLFASPAGHPHRNLLSGGGGGPPGSGGGSSGSGSGGGSSTSSRLFAPPLAPGLPPRVSTHVAVLLCVLGFFLGRMVTPAAPATLPAAAPPPPPAASSSALPLPALPAHIRALAAPDARHAALSSAIARGDLNATALLPEMGPLGRAWLRESGLLALRPPLVPAESGSAEILVQPLQVLSWWPRIVLYPNFIDGARRERIVALAQHRLQRSGLAFKPGAKVDPNQKARTSRGTFLSREDDPSGVVAWVEEKIAALTLLPVSHGEAFNYLEYEEGEHYDSHMDTFDPRDFGPQRSQRAATVLVYLTDCEGGETIFKREGVLGASRPVPSWGDCSPSAGGYRYKPRAGDALLFFSLTPDGEIDPRALHGGCPVLGGPGGEKKAVLTKWIHNKPLSPVGPAAAGAGADRKRRRG